MKSKHTPGPWVIGSGAFANNIVGAYGIQVAAMFQSPQRDANMNLIIAAPVLLKAAQDLMDAEIPEDNQWTALRYAILMANGTLKPFDGTRKE